MNENLAQTAISLALKCMWTEAIKVNKQILNQDDTDTEALNRLARAYYESGDAKKAKVTSLKVLRLDGANKIAEKAILRYKGSTRKGKTGQIIASDFMEEQGKTKLTNLLNLGSERTLSCLNSGDEAKILSHSHRVTINAMDGKYIGKLPDDLSARLRSLIKSGNKYKVLVKSAQRKEVKILIREIGRGKGLENTQSFPGELLESSSEVSS